MRNSVKPEKWQKDKKTKKAKSAVTLSLAILTIGLMTGCGSDEMEEYRDDTANTMNNAVDYVEDARDVAEDMNDAASQPLEDIE